MDQPLNQSKLTYSGEYSPKISRWFVFRFLYLFIEIWVMYVWMFWIALVSFVHFWFMLITGTRNQNLWNRQHRFMRHVSKWQAYLNNLVDQRPNWIEE